MKRRGRILVTSVLIGLVGVGLYSMTRSWFAESRPEFRFPPSDYLPPPLGETKAKDEACVATYTRLHSRPRTDVRIVLGYKDARPARFVGDRYERATIVDYLTAECVDGFFACGFARDEDDADGFTKTISVDGKPHAIDLRLVHSSVGPDDDANREDSYQPVQSLAAQTAFLSGVRDADVVFYNGHSRDGGGPDFFPPRLRAGGRVDYNGYHFRRSGLGELQKALRARREPLPLLGLFSCASSRHFVDAVRAEKSGTGVIASPRLLYYADALKDLLAALSGVIGGACANELDRAMNKSERVGFFSQD